MAAPIFPSSPTDGQEYTVNGMTWAWDAAAGRWDMQSGASAQQANAFEKTASMSGALVDATAGTQRYYFTDAVTLTNVWASVATAPTGSAAVFDVKLNGTTIFAGGGPSIAAGQNVDLVNAPTTAAVDAGDYLTVDVVTASGAANAVVGIQYEGA